MKRLAPLLLVACGSSASPPKTPDGALHAFIAALQRADASAVIRGMPDPERLAKAISCTGTQTPIDRLRVSISAMRGFPQLLSNVKLEVRGIDDGGERTIAKGEDYRGCTANEPFAVHAFTLHKHVTSTDKKVDDADEATELIQLDGLWYVMAKDL